MKREWSKDQGWSKHQQSKMMVDHYSDQIDKVAEECRTSVPIGELFESSGYRETKFDGQPMNMDWAVFRRTDESRSCRNRLTLTGIPERFALLKLDPKVRLPFKSEEQDIKDAGLEVLLSGRTSGKNQGVQGGFRSGVTLKGCGSGTREWAFVGGKVGTPLSSKGDSGGWLIDNCGRVVAMVIGGNTKTNVTYATPVSALMVDIEKLTGKKILIHE